MSLANAEHAAGLLADLRVRAGQDAAIDDLPPVCQPATLLDGYVIQRRVRELLAHRAPGRQVGWKIGCTTKKIQDYLKIPHPCAGTLYQNRLHRGHVQIDAAQYFNLGLECEIAVRLSADLPAIEGHYTRETVAPAVADVMASIELIEHRYRDFSKVSAASLVADDVLSAGCVLGEAVPVDDLSDLATLRGGFSVDGALPGQTGRGAEVQGHPLAALAWLADLASRLNTPLRAGQVITLGSLIEVHYPKRGTTIEARIDRLPPVSVAVI
ncbi:MAG: fumarylacetoacetate hydrolase family protein [Pseudomonadota bacterium]